MEGWVITVHPAFLAVPRVRSSVFSPVNWGKHCLGTGVSIGQEKRRPGILMWEHEFAAATAVAC